MNNFNNEYNKYRKWHSVKYNTKNGINELKTTKIPAKNGVYIIRASQKLNRVNGKSDIIYIGQSGGGQRKGNQGIGSKDNSIGRLFNTRSTHELNVRKKIEELHPKSKFKVEYYLTKVNQDPKIIENGLLTAYFNDHFELPPANNHMPKIKSKKN
jgi:hypothetical protein